MQFWQSSSCKLCDERKKLCTVGTRTCHRQRKGNPTRARWPIFSDIKGLLKLFFPSLASYHTTLQLYKININLIPNDFLMHDYSTRSPLFYRNWGRVLVPPIPIHHPWPKAMLQSFIYDQERFLSLRPLSFSTITRAYLNNNKGEWKDEAKKLGIHTTQPESIHFEGFTFLL